MHAVGQRAVGRLDHVDLVQVRKLAAHLEDPLEETVVFDDGDLGLGVTGEVFDLLG